MRNALSPCSCFNGDFVGVCVVVQGPRPNAARAPTEPTRARVLLASNAFLMCVYIKMLFIIRFSLFLDFRVNELSHRCIIMREDG